MNDMSPSYTRQMQGEFERQEADAQRRLKEEQEK
jgi:hypothetical protein